MAAAGADGARLVGLGGSVRNLAAAAARGRAAARQRAGLRAGRDALDALVDELAGRTPEERERFPGIKRGRGEVILAATVVLRAVLEASGADGIEVTEAGLREGIFLSGLLAPPTRRWWRTCATSVRNLARQHGVDLAHAEHIAGLAHQLLEALPGAGLPEPGEPELVEAAALLHDVGMAVDYDDHHKHSCYLILGSGLPGFTPREVALIALMARYHRKGTPRSACSRRCAREGDEQLAAARRGAAADRRAARAQPRPGRARGAPDAAAADGESSWSSTRSATTRSRAGAPSARASCSSARSARRCASWRGRARRHR